MAVSIIESALADLIVEAKTISVANGYRNDPVAVENIFKEISQVMDFPHVMVFFNDGLVDAFNDAKTSFTEHVEVHVSGYIKGESDELTNMGESLLHDFKKMLAGFVSKYINTVNKGYHIQGRESMLHTWRMIPYISKTNGVVGISFTIKTRTVDSSFG